MAFNVPPLKSQVPNAVVTVLLPVEPIALWNLKPAGVKNSKAFAETSRVLNPSTFNCLVSNSPDEPYLAIVLAVPSVDIVVIEAEPDVPPYVTTPTLVVNFKLNPASKTVCAVSSLGALAAPEKFPSIEPLPSTKTPPMPSLRMRSQYCASPLAAPARG